MIELTTLCAPNTPSSWTKWRISRGPPRVIHQFGLTRGGPAEVLRLRSQTPFAQDDKRGVLSTTYY